MKRERERVKEELRRNTTQKGRVTRGSDDVKRADGYSGKGHGGMKGRKKDCTGREREREEKGGREGGGLKKRE